jgi:hypothetical protein
MILELVLDITIAKPQPSNHRSSFSAAASLNPWRLPLSALKENQKIKKQKRNSEIESRKEE